MAATKYGLTVAFSTKPADLMIQVKHAEGLGFDSIWLGEHLARPAEAVSKYPYAKSTPFTDREECYDSIALLAAAAAATQTIHLCTGIYLFPLRHPVVAARSAATMQTVSVGRFRFGIAAGWAKEEFDLLGVSFEERGAIFDEGMIVMRKALAGGDFEHHGKYYQCQPISITNNAIDVPIIIGGHSRPALRRAALLGDGWLSAPGASVVENLSLIGSLREMRTESKKANDPFTIYIRAPDASRDDVARYAEVGVNDIVLGGRQIFLPSASLDEKLIGLDRLAKELRMAA